MNILDENLHSLTSDKAKEMYQSLVHKEETVIHCTFTCNPMLNRADILSQYRGLIREIKSSKIFYYKTRHEFQIHPGFRHLMLVPELTKTINTHLHGILVIDKPYIDYFINELRRLCWNNEFLGRQATFNLMSDTLKDRTKVAEYAFKDIEQLLKFPDSKKMGILAIHRK